VRDEYHPGRLRHHRLDQRDQVGGHVADSQLLRGPAASAEPGPVVGDQPCPAADSVSYRQGTLWLTPDELTDLINELLTVLQPRLGNQPAPGRAPYLLSPVLFPTGPPSP
jgi:hypothetical protein